jgi:sec-independent protein translocase protein TatB
MPQIGPMEILVVGVIALIVFGPQKLPEIARSIGRAASELRRMATDVRDEFEAGINFEDREEDGGKRADAVRDEVEPAESDEPAGPGDEPVSASEAPTGGAEEPAAVTPQTDDEDASAPGNEDRPER